jgi:hypothetical protein
MCSRFDANQVDIPDYVGWLVEKRLRCALCREPVSARYAQTCFVAFSTKRRINTGDLLLSGRVDLKIQCHYLVPPSHKPLAE